MLSSVLDNGVTLSAILMSTGVSIVLGFLISVVYMFHGRCSKSMAVALVIMPVLVQWVIMMVNDNLSIGIAIAGAFSLIRFRSAPASAKEVAYVFFAMGIGLVTSTGYLVLAAIFTVIVCAVFLLVTKTRYGEGRLQQRQLKILIPENLNYNEVFDDIFNEYASSVMLVRSKTTNLGSMYELTYRINLKDPKKEKEFIDKIRCRNGNLTVCISSVIDEVSEVSMI